MCSLAFDPSLELVIVSYCTTHNVCIVIHMYVCCGDASDKLAFIRIYVAATIYLLLALTVGVHSLDFLFE